MERTDILDELILELTEIFKDELLLEPVMIYADLLRDGYGNAELIRGILYDYNDLLEDYERYGHYAYIAFALFQFNLGRLDKFVKTKALKVIEQDINQYVQLENPLLSLDQLNEMKYKLEEMQPSKVKIPRKPYYKCEWKLGDVFAYQITDEKTPIFNPRRDKYPFDDYLKKYDMMNKYVMFVKMGENGSDRTLSQVISFLNWYGDEPLRDIEVIKAIEIIPSSVFFDITIYNTLFADNKEEIDRAELIYIGNIEGLEIRDFSDYSKYNSRGQVYMDNINSSINIILLQCTKVEQYRNRLFKEKNKFLV